MSQPSYREIARARLRRLTTLQSRAIPVILEAPTLAEAARQLGVNEQTCYGWMKKPVFREAIEAARQEAYEEAMADLKASVRIAVRTLKQLVLTATSDAVRERAARTLLTHAQVLGLSSGGRPVTAEEVIRLLRTGEADSASGEDPS